MPLVTLVSLLPTAISAVGTISQIVQNMMAAGRATTTADENAQLAIALNTLANANAAFNAEFADVLPKA